MAATDRSSGRPGAYDYTLASNGKAVTARDRGGGFAFELTIPRHLRLP